MERVEKFKGVTVSMTTALDDDRGLDLETMREKTDYLINNGINVLLVTGSIGECYSLNDEERFKLWEVVIEKAAGRCPVIAGTNHTFTDKAVELAKKAEELGADGILNLPPYYWDLNEEAIYRHLERLNQSVSTPIFVYNNPPINGVDYSLELIKRFAALENIVALKDCTSDIVKLERRVREVNDIVILHGRNELYVPYGTLMGTFGHTSGPGNWCAEIVMTIYDLEQKGKYREALKLRQEKISPIFDYLGQFTTTQAVAAYKYIESLVNIPTGPPRLPGYELDDIQKRELEEVVGRIF